MPQLIFMPVRLRCMHVCVSLVYVKTKNFKKYISLDGQSPSRSQYPLGASILVPSALAPRSKILDPPLASATVLVAVPTSVPSLGRWLEAATATVTSAVAPAVAWAGSQPSEPRSPWSPVRQAPNSMAWPVVELDVMEGGQSVIGLLIIGSSCTLQSFSRQLAYSPVSLFT